MMLYLWFLPGVHIISGQEKGFVTPDSLQGYSYDSLYNSFLEVSRDTIQSKIYLYSFLEKATSDRDTIKMAEAYCNLSYYMVEESKKIRLLDRSINMSEGLSDKIYPVRAYSFKGWYYLEKGNYQLALDNYIKALTLSEKVNNTKYINITNHNIGLIKAKIDKHKEALFLFKKNFENIKTNHKTNTVRYLKSLTHLAQSYSYNQKLDSASIYNREGILLLQKNENLQRRFYSKFILNEGVNLFFKKEYKKAHDSIIKGVSLLNKNNPVHKENYILGSFYLAKLKQVEGNALAAEKEFVRMDSIIQKENIILSEVREAYEFLVSINKAKGEKEQQLTYINKLLRFDSIINTQRASLSNRLFREFDTPLLIKEKETLIKELQNKAKSMNFLVSFFILLSVVTTIFMSYQYVRRKKYQEKFNKLLKKNEDVTIVVKKPLNKIGIAHEIVEDILNKLDLFEQNHQFLKKNISISTLAKEINTNTKYLSKVINHHKNKSFISYVNELRIQYSVEQLKENTILKNYTIQGIAEEMGFNSAVSFSSAFKKSTGIKPSYFIRKLETLNEK